MKTIKISLAIILLVLSYQTVNARIINVPADSSTIQKGINGTNNGDTVLVARGTYYENIDFLQKDILVASNYIFDGLQATVDSTIIYGVSLPLAPVVKMRYVDGANSGITGFTITYGYAQNGGGIFCEFSFATISHNVITGNTATSQGGGIYCDNSSPTIRHNFIVDNIATDWGGGIYFEDDFVGAMVDSNFINGNTARHGGGIYCFSSSTKIRANQITENSATDIYASGGGIGCSGNSSLEIIGNSITGNSSYSGGGIATGALSKILDNTIANNTAGYVGGGISVGGYSTVIKNNLITDNTAECGGGINCGGDSTVTIDSNVITKNRVSDSGGGIYCYPGSYPTIHKNTIDSNTADYGGGIRCASSSPSIVANTISGNSSISWGGGIVYHGSYALVKGNHIVGNHSGCGGGIYATGSHAIVTRNFIANNSATNGGGGITSSTDTSDIVNNTFDNNSGNQYENRAGGICCWSNAVPRIEHNIIVNSLVGCGIGCFPGSNPVISYNDVWNNSIGNFCGCPSGVGQNDTVNCNHDSCDIFFNISLNPLFDPDSTNYFLLCNSPCIDAGDPSDPVPPGGGRFIDMGWSEFPYIVGDANGDGSMPNLGDIVYLISYLYRGGPPPCPYGAGDVNCDCIINLGDVVYLIDYVYKGGPAPCGSKELRLSNSISPFNKLPILGEIQLVKSEFPKDGVTGLSVISDCNIDVAAIQVVLNYDPKQVRVFEPALTSRTGGFQIYYGNENGQLKIGILDITGAHHIPSGKGPIMTFKVMGENLEHLTISEAILVDLEAHTFLASSGEMLETQASLPHQYALHQNYPNPFNPETEISYDLPYDCWVKLSIYNITGQKVITLVDKLEATGHKTVVWDGKNEQGDEVASGVYFYRLEAGDFTATKRMVLLR